MGTSGAWSRPPIALRDVGNCYDLLKGASFEDPARSLGPMFVLVDLVG